MKRIENFRKGDRAEKLGIVLLQAFCAVAEIPRQEDFGLTDAVGTLLRRDDGFLYAEDSFLLQFKSRTEKVIEYAGKKFEALLCQDLPLLVARVDLKRSRIELHTLGIAFAHPNVGDAKALVAHLRPDDSCPFGLVGDVFHVPLNKPILAWSWENIEQRVFIDQAYAVLKAWFTLERWNRRYRRAGIFRQVQWEANRIPSEAGEMYTWGPSKRTDILREMAPLVRVLASQSTSEAELRAPIKKLFDWLRGQGVEADPEGNHWLMMHGAECQDRLKEVLDDNPTVDIVATYSIVEARPDFLAFWMFSRDQKGLGSGHRYAGTLEALRTQGFTTTVEGEANELKVSISADEAVLGSNEVVGLKEADQASEINREGMTGFILLRRKAENAAQPESPVIEVVRNGT